MGKRDQLNEIIEEHGMAVAPGNERYGIPDLVITKSDPNDTDGFDAWKSYYSKGRPITVGNTSTGHVWLQGRDLYSPDASAVRADAGAAALVVKVRGITGTGAEA